jgi:SAM-dependent methyltransferase
VQADPERSDLRYGRAFASDYDRLYAGRDDVDTIADRLERLAAGGATLELGVGTGRLAIPLARRGVEVVGVDNSQEMLDQLIAKPDGGLVETRLDDMLETDLSRRFSLVFLAFSTLFLLPDQELQLRCFETAARHLMPGGAFVVECFVHDTGRWTRDQEVTVVEVDDDRIAVRFAVHDRATQTIRSNVAELSANGLELRPNTLRYASPAELDLMARVAGLHLAERWAGWEGEPFGADSDRHVSVYRARRDVS